MKAFELRSKISPKAVIETQRLRLVELSAESDDDAAFMLRLLNEESYIRHIADRGVRTLEAARALLREWAVKSYIEHGHGPYRVEEKGSGKSLGNCGLMRREGLDVPDLGYAFLSEAHGQGYALEAARGVVEFARQHLGMPRLLAIVNPDNAASIRLLRKLGFASASTVCLPNIEHELLLFELAFQPA